MALGFVICTKVEAGSGTSWFGSVAGTAGNLWVSGAITGYQTTIGTGINTTDNSGSNTWTRDANGTHTFSAPLSENAYSISSAPNIAGGTDTVTFTPQGGSGPAGGTGFVLEFSGAATSSPNSDASPALNINNGSTSVATSSLTNTNSANAVFVAFFGDNLASGTSTLTETGTGWTMPSGGSETNATSFYPAAVAYKIVSSTAAQSNTWTITSAGWGALIADYKQAAAVGGTDTPVIPVQIPNRWVGPPAMRQAKHSPVPFDTTQAAAVNYEFATRVRIPNNRVGPMALRALYRSPAYPFDSTVAPVTAQSIVFRKTLSPLGARTGSRQNLS